MSQVSAQSIKAKLRHYAATHSANPKHVFQEYILERFLARMAESRHGYHFVLKGGLLVTFLVGIADRSTNDIDTTIIGATLEPDEIQRIIGEICSLDLADGFVFRIKRLSTIIPGAEYPGIRMAMEAKLGGTVTPFNIDISTGDAITPKAVEYKYMPLLSDEPIEILTYNLETLLAEKLETIISRADSTTRMRDFFDIHILLETQSNSFQVPLFQMALMETAAHRKSQKALDDASERLRAVQTSAALRGHWERYKKQYDYALDLEWDDVLHSVMKLAGIAGLLEA